MWPLGREVHRPTATVPPTRAWVELQAVLAVLRDVIEHASGTVPMASAQPTLEHIAALVMPLAAADNFDEDAWDQVLPSFSQCTLSTLCWAC